MAGITYAMLVEASNRTNQAFRNLQAIEDEVNRGLPIPDSILFQATDEYRRCLDHELGLLLQQEKQHEVA